MKQPLITSDTKNKEFSNSIDKTLSVIDCIFEEEGTFIDIQKKLNLPKATLHRILQSLEKYGLIEKVAPTDHYRLGLKFIYYSEAVKTRLSIPSIAQPFLQSLSASIGESAGLTVLFQEHCLSLASCRGEESALTSNLLPFPTLNCCSAGKLFLSSWSDEQLTEYFSNAHLKKLTHNTIITYDDFKKEQAKILKNGFSCDDEENEYGLFCLSVPLFNHTGQINANIGITAPKSRLFTKDVDAIILQLKDTAREISYVLIKTKCVCPY